MDFEYYYKESLPILELEKVKVRITKRTLEKAKVGDSIMCPIAIAIRKKIKWGDAITTNDEIFYYRSEFNRNDTESVLGRDKIARVLLEDKAILIMKKFNETLTLDIPTIVEVKVPKILLIKF